VRVDGTSRHVCLWTFGASIRDCCLGDPNARAAWWRRIDGSLDELVSFMEAEELKFDLRRIEMQLGRVVPPPPNRVGPASRRPSPYTPRDAFALLGLTWPCSETDVRAAWKRAAFENHPDRGGTHDEFLTIHRAYEMCLALVRAAASPSA
jgi:hypothetical protein